MRLHPISWLYNNLLRCGEVALPAKLTHPCKTLAATKWPPSSAGRGCHSFVSRTALSSPCVLSQVHPKSSDESRHFEVLADPVGGGSERFIVSPKLLTWKVLGALHDGLMSNSAFWWEHLFP